jgi:hypothetical protein
VGSFIIEKIFEVDWFMTKIVLVKTLIILVHVVVLVQRFKVAHFFSCFVNLFLKLRKTKHHLQLLVDCFEIVDLLVKLLVLWF